MHFSKVAEGFFRGPRPKSLEHLQMMGVKRIINLQSGFYELVSEDKRENQYPVDFGMEYYDLGSSNIFPPENKTIDKVLELLKDGKFTYVHCFSGVDRTGFIVACYRMAVQKWGYQEAHQEFVDMGRHWWFSHWRYSLRKQYERLTGNKK